LLFTNGSTCTATIRDPSMFSVVSAMMDGGGVGGGPVAANVGKNTAVNANLLEAGGCTS
jgi:hypothetical protein